MAVVSCMLDGMTNKQDKAGPGRPKGRKPTEAIYVRVAPSLAKRFNDLVEAMRPKTSVTGVVTMLIEDWVKAQSSNHEESDD
jgi:hypothetical protein